MIQRLNFIHNRTFFIVASIIFIGLILRLWNFYNLFYFAIDEEKGAYIIQGIATGNHFPTVGHPTSIGFRLGPFYYYLISPLFKLFTSSPVIIGYLSVIVSIVTMTLLYQISSKINKITGILTVFLFSISYFNVIYERRGWQLSFEHLFILIIILSILKLRMGKQKYIFPLTASIIILTQFEIGLFNLIPLILLSFYLFKIKINKKYVLTSLAAIFIVNSGLIIFDLRHQFLNTRYIINYFRPDANIRIAKNVPLSGIRSSYLAHNLIPNTLARTLLPYTEPNLALQYANCPQYLSFKQSAIPLWLKLVVLVILLFSFIIAWRHKNSPSDKSTILILSALFFVIHFTAIAFYTYKFNGEMAEYYLIPTLVFFFITIANILSGIWKTRYRWLVFIFLIFFAYININSLFRSKNPYGLKQKIEAVNFSLSYVKNEPFILDSFQTCWYSGGYRYLYTLAGKEPLTSYMDQYLSEYYTPVKITQPKYLVVILTPELVGSNPSGYEIYKDRINSTADHKEKFGAIEVYIKKL